MNEIYLDHAATTPLHPDVLESMLPYLRNIFGNPSSIHAYGRMAKRAISEARDAIASSLHCSPQRLVFTSGGTESDNLAIFGATMQWIGQGKHIITTQIEHHAVLNAAKQLEASGFAVTYLPVDSTGKIRLEDLSAAIREDTCLISVMYGNNEVGTIQPIRQVAELAHERGILLHVDAVQAMGHEAIDLSVLPVDFMSFSAHKINGPKGIGLLYVSPQARISPLLFGGAQESGRRAGTENVAGIVGFAEAVRRSHEQMDVTREMQEQMRTKMVETLSEQLGSEAFQVNGHPDRNFRLNHILNVSFLGVQAETMVMNLDLEGVAVSSGAACSSGALEPSHVLQAMQVSPELADSAIRFSFGHGNCLENVTIAAHKVASIVRRLRHN